MTRKVLVACLGVALVALGAPSSSSVLPAAGPRAPGTELGVPWSGSYGITETVAEIMARQAQFDAAHPQHALQVVPVHLIGRSRSRIPGAPVLPSAPAGAMAITPAVGLSFIGATLGESGFIPPDSDGAVGPTQFLVAVNGRIKVYSKTGVLGPLDASTNVFFNTVRNAANTSDPRVRYDRLSGRWFVVMINAPTLNGSIHGPNRVMIAVSSGSTITSNATFTFFQFQQDLVGPTPNPDTNGFADFPSLGVDPFALYIGVNMFNQAGTAFTGATGFVVNKANLLSGTSTVTAFRQIGTTTTGLFAPQGVDDHDPSATEGYLIGVDVATFGKLVIRRITDPGGSPSISPNIDVTVPATTLPIFVPSLGSSHALDALDDRLGPATMIDGNLWTAQNIEVDTSGASVPGGGRDGSRWYELSNLTGSPILLQSGTIFDGAMTNPSSYWIPSIAANGQGDAAIGMSAAGANEYANAAVAERLETDPPGAMSAPLRYTSSSFAYNVQFVTPQRWGDYSTTTLDPCDNMTWWTIQEFTNANYSWGVEVAKVMAPKPATPSAASPSSIPAGMASVDVVVMGTQENGSGFYDPGAGFACRIRAAVTGGVTVNSVTFTDPIHVTLNLSTAGATAGPQTIAVTNPDGQSAQGAGLLTISTPTPQVDLSVTKADSPDPVAKGTDLTYTIGATNNGPDQATGVKVIDKLPITVTFVSATPSTGSCSFDSLHNRVVCKIAALASGSSAGVTVHVTPTAAGSITNKARVRAKETDPNTENNLATATTQVT